MSGNALLLIGLLLAASSAVASGAAELPLQLPAAATATTPTTTGQPCPVYNQSGVFVCLPSVSSAEIPLYGGVRVAHVTASAVVLEFFAVADNTKIDAEVRDRSGSLLWSGFKILRKNEAVNESVSIPSGADYVVLVVKVNGVELLPGAVLIPKNVFAGVSASHPLVSLFLALIPAAPILSFLLSSKPRVGAVAAMVSLPFVYVIASYLAVDQGAVIAVMAASLVASIAVYVVSGGLE